MYRLLYATFSFIQCCLIQTTLSVVTQKLMRRLNKKIKTLVKMFYAIWPKLSKETWVVLEHFKSFLKWCLVTINVMNSSSIELILEKIGFNQNCVEWDLRKHSSKHFCSFETVITSAKFHWLTSSLLVQ